MSYNVTMQIPFWCNNKVTSQTQTHEDMNAVQEWEVE